MVQHNISITTEPVRENSNVKQWKVWVNGDMIPVQGTKSGEIAVIRREEQEHISEDIAKNSTSLDDSDTIGNLEKVEEFEDLEENEAKSCRAIEPVILPPSMYGYLTLTTTLPGEIALFEPV